MPKEQYQVHLMDGLLETTWETMRVLERASTTDLRSVNCLVIRTETCLERHWVHLLVTQKAPLPVIHSDHYQVLPMDHYQVHRMDGCLVVSWETHLVQQKATLLVLLTAGPPENELASLRVLHWEHQQVTQSVMFQEVALLFFQVTAMVPSLVRLRMDWYLAMTRETMRVLQMDQTTDFRSVTFLVIRRETCLERRWGHLLVTQRAPFPVIHLDLCPVTPMANFPEPHPARPMVRNLVNQ